MGVTAEHPLFAVGEGWLTAGELSAGDAIRDSGLQEVRVLSVALDDRPRIVHNLEVAGAHTYFAGELEAWGHNSGSRVGRIGALVFHLASGCYDFEKRGDDPDVFRNISEGEYEPSRIKKEDSPVRKKANPKSCPWTPSTAFQNRGGKIIKFIQRR